MIIIDTNELAPEKAVTEAGSRRRAARAHIQTVATQMGEESTYAELVVRHERGSGAYWAELRPHIELKKPNGRTSILFKLAGPSKRHHHEDPHRPLLRSQARRPLRGSARPAPAARRGPSRAHHPLAEPAGLGPGPRRLPPTGWPPLCVMPAPFGGRVLARAGTRDRAPRWHPGSTANSSSQRASTLQSRQTLQG